MADSLYQRMKNRLKKTKDNFKEKLDNIMYYGKLDDDFFEEVEENLILADLGIETTTKIIDDLKDEIKQKKVSGSEEAVELLKAIIMDSIKVEAKPYQYPLIITMVGVNGVGKTTTIAKLAQKYSEQGKKVLVAAADTFRAAAAEQLDAWAERLNIETIKSNTGADPSAVIFDAIISAKAKQADVLICDTAGRLHNKVNLMKELEKIAKIIDREGTGFDSHNVLVVDATTGQNALIQAKTFNQAIRLDSIIMTKLDGSAKGGVVIPIINELKIPIEYAGIGEKAEDLIPFDAAKFVELLFEKEEDFEEE